MLSLGAITDRFLTFCFLPVTIISEKFLALNQLKNNSELRDLLVDGVLDLSDLLPSLAKHDLQTWVDNLSCVYSQNNNSKTIRHYNVHLAHPLPSNLFQYLNPILNVYFNHSRWIIDQTQWQLSVPSATALPGQGFHIDAYYPSLKLFIYKGPVNMSNGPMLYIKGSHRWPKNVFKRALWSLFRPLKLTYFPRTDRNEAKPLLSENSYSFFLCDMRLLHSSSQLFSGSRTVTVINFRKRYSFV